MTFKEKLQKIVKKNNSLLCIGLDVDQQKMPAFLFKTEQQPFLAFNKKIIDATKKIVCAYKLNLAFYEVLGTQGMELLNRTIAYIPKDIVVILDGKRNDIGNTAKKYAQMLYETLTADAVTINPYLGFDSIAPFLNYPDKCCFILCRTSNPSAKDFQDLSVGGKPLYQIVAEKIKEWNTTDCCGGVVGATFPKELQKIRHIIGEEIPLLIPGVGAQGGSVKNSVTYGTNTTGEMALITSSRSIIYAGNDETFATASGQKAQQLRDEINTYRP